MGGCLATDRNHFSVKPGRVCRIPVPLRLWVGHTRRDVTRGVPACPGVTHVGRPCTGRNRKAARDSETASGAAPRLHGS
jgi:hypothetical protein